MSLFRSVLFWLHLAAGVACGVIIGVLCLTGAALAFEKELVAWAERDARQVAAPAPGAPRLGVDELAGRVRAAFPGVKIGNVVVSSDPHTAVAFPVSRTEGYYANPYTGEVRQPASYAMGRFMQTMLEWHRYLGFSGQESRPHGKLATGIANLAFLFLAVSGLVLWWPRSLSWRAMRPSIWFTQNSSSRARDWNWHNTLGFWSAPILIILTLTAMPISFRWAGELIYTLTGTPLPPGGPQSSGAPPPAATVPLPGPDASPASRDAMLAAIQREHPAWTSVTFRLAAPPDPAKAQPVSFTVREAGTWPRTATTTLQFDPFTGVLLQRDGYADLSAARKVRSWTRFLHTGEALGPWAQLVAGLASFAGFALAYTGFALAFRRFIRRRAVADSARQG
jgi:uncharacterized iron-regulated membrane protein